jgi:pimeloyl-ACP methyl ester carboxylesterase
MAGATRPTFSWAGRETDRDFAFARSAGSTGSALGENPMTDMATKLADMHGVSGKVAALYQRRLTSARDHYDQRVREASAAHLADLTRFAASPWDVWKQWGEYSVDLAQRAVLFLDTLRLRGNDFVEHTRKGLPPVLHFDYEMVLDARGLERPVNYALVRIVPPDGVSVDARRRPYVVIDPRAGHGPGVGGFKDDSQVGVALRDGHPVYFVIFYPEPMPGQTLLDVTAAEREFLRRVRALHPQSPKPAIVGNCQGGWAAMMLAATDPEHSGPIVINGAPMSYWGGAWRDGAGDNPMRYSGGLLGGSWLASFTADLGNGVFDGAHLVQNFENLNPANTFWDKYYHLFANIDDEGARFLEFERWWGGFYLLNREEIEWIVDNLFVGNKVWDGGVRAEAGKTLDLRSIKSPIVIFASMGDNITPPQQAFNWVADIYGSTDEIKARGQVIVGLLHEDIGHLGIFVSGKVANKEHAQIVSVLKSIEALAPGLYGMQIHETPGRDGQTQYEVEFVEHRLEEVVARLNRVKRSDEKPFEAVAAVSEFNQRAYELFARPLVQAVSNEYGATLAREFHPLRFQRWSFSDLNPWLGWLAPAADWVHRQRLQVDEEQPFRRAERVVSTLISASLDYYRDLRDATSEALFFQTYGNLFAAYLGGEMQRPAAQVRDPRSLPFVREALESIARGGYAEAVARLTALLEDDGIPFPLSHLEMLKDVRESNPELVPDLPPDALRRIRGEQEIIVRYEPARALETLPALLAQPEDRARFGAVLQLMTRDPRVLDAVAAPRKQAILAHVRALVAMPTPTAAGPAPAATKGRRRSGTKPGGRRK